MSGKAPGRRRVGPTVAATIYVTGDQATVNRSARRIKRRAARKEQQRRATAAAARCGDSESKAPTEKEVHAAAQEQERKDLRDCFDRQKDLNADSLFFPPRTNTALWHALYSKLAATHKLSRRQLKARLRLYTIVKGILPSPKLM